MMTEEDYDMIVRQHRGAMQRGLASSLSGLGQTKQEQTKKAKPMNEHEAKAKIEVARIDKDRQVRLAEIKDNDAPCVRRHEIEARRLDTIKDSILALIQSLGWLTGLYLVTDLAKYLADAQVIG